MKILYGARYARPDLLRAVCGLATKVTKWDKQADKEIHRLIEYINSTLHYRLVGWVGDPKHMLEVALYADADFAGDISNKSTSGIALLIQGPDTRFMMSTKSTRQSCTSHSSTESEIVAADVALRTVGLPALNLWDTLFGREVKCVFHEDNEAMIRVCKSGRNPTMRHLGRTHRVSVSWLYERFQDRWADLRYIFSAKQAADIFTKAFVNPEKWDQVRQLVNVVHPARFWHKQESYSEPLTRPIGSPKADPAKAKDKDQTPDLEPTTLEGGASPVQGGGLTAVIHDASSQNKFSRITSDHGDLIHKDDQSTMCNSDNAETSDDDDDWDVDHFITCQEPGGQFIIHEPTAYGHQVSRQITSPVPVASSNLYPSLSSVPAIYAKHGKRMLIEYCCGRNSVLGNSSKVSNDCDKIRLTEDIDMATPAGVQYMWDKGINHALSLIHI